MPVVFFLFSTIQLTKQTDLDAGEADRLIYA